MEGETERRSSERVSIIAEVEFCLPGGRSYRGCARDINQHGVWVDLYGDDPPGDGAVVEIQFHLWTGKSQIIRTLNGRVARSSPAGVAMVFEATQQETSAVVGEVLWYQQFERREKPRP